MSRGQVSDSQHHGDEEKEMGINWEYSECHVKIRWRGGEKVRTKDESKGDGAARTQQRWLEGLGFGKAVAACSSPSAIPGNQPPLKLHPPGRQGEA